MGTHFLIKGRFHILKFTELNGKAHILTTQGTYKLSENIYSDTFLVRKPDGFHPVPLILDATLVGTHDIFTALPVSSLHSPQWTSLMDIAAPKDARMLIRCYKLFVHTEQDGRLMAARIPYAEIVKTVCYMQALSSKSDFAMWNDERKQWAIDSFTGSSAELGMYVLLECLENGRGDGFVEEWRRKDLYEPDLASLGAYIEECGRGDREMLHGFLEKLKERT